MVDKYSALEALKDRVRLLGEDVDLFENLSFTQTLIEKFIPQVVPLPPAIAQRALPERICIGTFEGANIGTVMIWAYLLNNSDANRSIELMYASRLPGERIERNTAEQVYGGKLREEFRHCSSPAMLTATARFFLYKKGVTPSFAPKVSDHLAREVVRSCKTIGQAAGDSVFLRLQRLISTSAAKEKVHGDGAQTQHQSSVSGTIDKPINKLIVARNKEHELNKKIKQTRSQLKKVQSSLATERKRYRQLQVKLAESARTIALARNESDSLEKREKEELAAVQACNTEQKDIIERMDPELRGAIELGRQLERGFK